MAAASYSFAPVAGNAVPLYDTRQSQLHGWGLIAMQDITAGTHILHETAIWRVKCSIRDQDRKLLQSFRKLSREAQDTVLLLHGGSDNAADGEQDGDYFAIYPEIARLNHSCAPNCELMPAGPAARRLITCKDIKACEELTICYGDPCESRDRRLAFFADAFGFTTACECPVCFMCDMDKAFLETSDNRREELNAGQELVNDYTAGLGNLPDFSKYSEEQHRIMYGVGKTMVKLAMREKIAGALTAPMYQAVSMAARGLGWQDKALKYERKMMEVARRFLMV